MNTNPDVALELPSGNETPSLPSGSKGAASDFQAWLKTRPLCVQLLAAEFPLETTFEIQREKYYLLGYTENDMLIISKIDPREDYDGANATKEYFCAEHIRTPP